jgi:hypothetical protein
MDRIVTAQEQIEAEKDEVHVSDRQPDLASETDPGVEEGIDEIDEATLAAQKRLLRRRAQNLPGLSHLPPPPE